MSIIIGGLVEDNLILQGMGEAYTIVEVLVEEQVAVAPVKDNKLSVGVGGGFGYPSPKIKIVKKIGRKITLKIKAPNSQEYTVYTFEDENDIKKSNIYIRDYKVDSKKLAIYVKKRAKKEKKFKFKIKEIDEN